MRITGIIAIAVIIGGVVVVAADGRAPQVIVGKQLFETHCVTCHGAEARGDGALAKGLRKPPADLTKLARSNGGEFPTERVIKALEGTRQPALHSDMPVWSETFARMSEDNSAKDVRAKLAALADYLRTIQAKP